MELRNLKIEGFTHYRASDTGHIYDEANNEVHETIYKGGCLVSLVNKKTKSRKLFSLHLLIASVFLGEA